MRRRRRWRIVSPVFGLILFSAVSYRSYETQRGPSKYFYWPLVRLDSDPANKDTNWDLTCADRWVDPELLDKILLFSALPAFIVGGVAVSGLGRLRVNQVSSFMFLMPILIAAWYYFIGRVFVKTAGRRIPNRAHPPATAHMARKIRTDLA
jgi:hypothetical protein